MNYSDFDNTIIDAIYERMLRYMRNTVAYHDLDVNLYNKEWEYDRVGRVIYNYIHTEDDDIEIIIGMSKNFDSWFIQSDAKGGCSTKVYSKAHSLGSMVDEVSTDTLNIEDELINGIENGFLI